MVLGGHSGAGSPRRPVTGTVPGVLSREMATVVVAKIRSFFVRLLALSGDADVQYPRQRDCTTSTGTVTLVVVDGSYSPRRLDDPVLVTLSVVDADRRLLLHAAVRSAGRVAVIGGDRVGDSEDQVDGLWRASVVVSERADGSVVITDAGNERMDETAAAGQLLWLGESEPDPAADGHEYGPRRLPNGSTVIPGAPPRFRTRWRPAGQVGGRVDTPPEDAVAAIAGYQRPCHDRRDGPYVVPDPTLEHPRPHPWHEAVVTRPSSSILPGAAGRACTRCAFKTCARPSRSPCSLATRTNGQQKCSVTSTVMAAVFTSHAG